MLSYRDGETRRVRGTSYVRSGGHWLPEDVLGGGMPPVGLSRQPVSPSTYTPTTSGDHVLPGRTASGGASRSTGSADVRARRSLDADSLFAMLAAGATNVERQSGEPSGPDQRIPRPSAADIQQLYDFGPDVVPIQPPVHGWAAHPAGKVRGSRPASAVRPHRDGGTYASTPAAKPNESRRAEQAQIQNVLQDPSAAAEETLRAGRRGPIIDNQSGTYSEIHFRDQLPETATWNWTEAQKAAIQNHIAKVRTPEELRAFALALSGGKATIGNADEVLEHYRKTEKVGWVSDVPLPVPARNPDGAVGAAARGVGDPFNLLDETGAIVDTLGLTGGRENIWNSDRAWKDILFGNIDLNRGILQADERDHFEARLAGQLASNILLPIGNKARGAGQLAKWGAGEGALAGFGAGEGNPLQRLPNSAAGAVLGGAGGYALGRVAEDVAPLGRGLMGRQRPLVRIDVDETPAPNAGLPTSVLPVTRLDQRQAHRPPPSSSFAPAAQASSKPVTRAPEHHRLAEALRNAVPEQEDFDDVDFGVLPKRTFARVNAVRRRLGLEPLRDQHVIIPGNVVKKIYRERLIKDKLTPERVADVAFSAFHGRKSHATRSHHEHIQALINPREYLYNLGFIAVHPMNGGTVLKSVYPVSREKIIRSIRPSRKE